ncbi:adenylate cyclase, partial [Tieghemiomyces parasiticus]
EEKRLVAGRDEATGKVIREGDVTTVNLTMLSGGKQHNIVPHALEACFDIRVSPFVDYEKFSAWLSELAHRNDVTLDYALKYTKPNVTLLENNPWWAAMQRVGKRLDIPHDADILTGATDSRWVRCLGIPCLGVSPMRNHPILLHDHDEYVTVNCYLEGIHYYKHLIEELANVG